MMMRVVKRGLAEVIPVEQGSARREPAPVRRLEPALPTLVAARLESLDPEARTAQLRVGRQGVTAQLDPALEAEVLRTALIRRERVIAEREPGVAGERAEWVVLGVLRTSVTPGVDEGDEFLIKAKRIAVVAEHEFAVVSGAASLAVRAIGQVETLAQEITARASSVHRIIGRMIRLN